MLFFPTLWHVTSPPVPSSAQSRFRTVEIRGWLCEGSCVLPALLPVPGDGVPSAEPASPGIDSVTWLGIQTDENHCDLSAGFINWTRSLNIAPSISPEAPTGSLLSQLRGQQHTSFLSRLSSIWVLTCLECLSDSSIRKRDVPAFSVGPLRSAGDSGLFYLVRETEDFRVLREPSQRDCMKRYLMNVLHRTAAKGSLSS